MLDMIKENKKRQSLQLITVADQSPCFLMNKREQRLKYFYAPNENTSTTRKLPMDKEEKRKSSIRLLQLISNQQQQYEASMQLVALSNEINFLSDKLISTEERVSKWKKEFKDLHNKFIQVVNDHKNTQEQLEDTRRMLAESEHIRSRWFLKTSPHEEYVTSATLPKKLISHPHHR